MPDGSGIASILVERKILIRGRFEPYRNDIRVSMGRIEDIEVFRAVFDELTRS